MITWAGFAVLGCACGLYLRFPGFGIATVALCLTYGLVTRLVAGATGLELALAVTLATIALQVGYLAGLAIQIGVARLCFMRRAASFPERKREALQGRDSFSPPVRGRPCE